MKHIKKFIEAGGYLSVSSQYFMVSTSSDTNVMRLPIIYFFAKEGSCEYELLEYYLKVLMNLNKKSPQEIAAEEAVEKAESALKAAKDVLKTVKEK